MSYVLNWYRPPAEPSIIDGCRHPLKGILAQRYTDTDGSLRQEFILTNGEAAYVQGLVDAGVEGAASLLDALTQYGSLVLRIED